jgi:hypothetical protein
MKRPGKDFRRLKQDVYKRGYSSATEHEKRTHKQRDEQYGQ